MELKGKLAVITGVSKGIGLEAAKALLNEGMKVAGWSRTSPEIESPDFYFISTDVSKADSVKNAYLKTVEHFGMDVSVLINNAGLGYDARLEDMKDEDWVKMFDVNVHGVYFCSKLVIPAMKEKGEGYIINIGSIASTTGTETLSGYCGTKFAVRGISQALYKELRGYGVKVSLINPGSVQTQFFENISSIEVHENMMKPEWIAESIVYLLQSPENYHPVELEVRPLMPKGRIKP